MRRKLAISVLLSLLTYLVLSLVPLTTDLTPDAAADTAKQGYWQLSNVTDRQADDVAVREEDLDLFLEHSYQQGNYSLEWQIIDHYYDEAISGGGVVTARFSGLPEIIIPGELISIQVSMTSTYSGDPDMQLQDQVSAGIQFFAKIEQQADLSEHRFSLPIGLPTELSETIAVVFKPDNDPEAIPMGTMSVEFSLGSLPYPFDSGTQSTEYEYIWVEGESASVPAGINLRGLVRSIENKPMPWLKLEAFVYYGQNTYPGTQPDRVISGSTDHQGRYLLQLPFDPDQSGPVGIMLVGTLTCVHPFKDHALLFNMIDMADPSFRTSESISIATWLSVDPADYTSLAEGEPIDIYRLLAYYHLGLDAWSFDAAMEPDPLYFFSESTGLAPLVEAYSMLYTAAFDAWFLGGIVLDQETSLLARPVRIELRWPIDEEISTSSHYAGEQNIIRLTEDDSKRDDSSRFTLLHEFGHYFDYSTNSNSFRAARGYGPNDTNHGGYFNYSTSDSYLEGLATAYAGLVQQFSGYPRPEVVGPIVLSSPSYYLAWGGRGKHEELAIASLLYQMLFRVDDVETYWSMLQPDRLNFYEYYQAFAQTMAEQGSDASGWLHDYAISAGLFTMPFGSGQYEEGEPFLDHGNSGRYDQGEPFADLMYETGPDGMIDYDQPLQPFEDSDLVAGQVSPANPPDGQPRQTLERSADSYLALSGEPLEYALIRYYPDDGDAYALLIAVEEDSLYVALPSRMLNGRVEVWVPGGQLIWQAELKQLQEKLMLGGGYPSPLAQVDVESSQLAPAGTIPAAVYGQPEAAGILEIPVMSSQELVQLASAFDAALSYEQVRQQLGQRTFTQTGSSSGYPVSPPRDPAADSAAGSGRLLLLIFLFLFLLSAIVFVSIKLIGRTRPAADYQQTPAHSWQQPAYSAPSEKEMHADSTSVAKPAFCGQCGQTVNQNARFCANCGRQF